MQIDKLFKSHVPFRLPFKNLCHQLKEIYCQPLGQTIQMMENEK